MAADIRTFVRTLLLNGYSIDSVQRSDAADVFEVHRVDELGARVAYAFLIASSPNDAVIAPFVTRAQQLRATPVGLGSFSTALFPVLSFQEFYHILGGSVDEGIIYDDELPMKLDDLGHNRVPSARSGKADDLLEEFTKQSLQFVTGRRSRRYGKERLFEPVPDGIIFEDLAILIDSKAYSAGFKIEADDVV
jgi:hypothetical protein